MESTFGSHAVGDDALERFCVCFREKGVDAVDGKCGFEPICSFDVPGREDDLGVEGAFYRTGGMEFEAEGDGESLKACWSSSVRSTACLA